MFDVIKEIILFCAFLISYRRCTKNVFAILVMQWRILKRRLGEDPQNAEEVVKVLCILHHCLMDERAGRYCAADYADSVNAVGE